jgi:hypothetical protein
MLNKKHILFIVPDGVGIKNYLYSNILTYLKEDNIQIVIWSPLPKQVFEEIERLHGISIKYKYIKLLPEPFLTRLYREATTYARLKFNAKLKNNETILFNWPKPKGFSKRSYMQRVAQLLGDYLAKDYQRILTYEARSKRHWKTSFIDQYRYDLEDLNPQSIFITHQRVASLMPLSLAAKQLGITVNTVIFSWDNLPKARLCVEADNYLVWGHWMQQEMVDYYPEISKTKVKLVGTPQFEFYLDETKASTRDAFAEQHNLDVNKTWICFSGDDERTSPYDPQYLNDLAEALCLRTDIQIIFRRCPVDFSERYDYVLDRFDALLKSINPIWNTIEGSWGMSYPDYNDVSLQINLAKHCNLVVNLGSTMAFDFSIFNKPCVYINYDVVASDHWSVKTIYQFQHFRSMKDLQGVVWLNSKDDINKIITKILNESVKTAKDKGKWRDHVVLSPLNESSKRIAKHLLLNGVN